MTADSFSLSRPLAVDGLPANGLEAEVEATEEERRTLAEMLDILAIHSLTGRFTVKPWRRDGVKVTGVVEAEVDQACVVSLEPVRQTVREEVDLAFLPGAELPPAGAEIEVDPDAPDLPEPLEDGRIDLGAVTAEHMALGLDPYPRAPGVAFEGWIEDDGRNDGGSPFAGLKALKPGEDR